MAQCRQVHLRWSYKMLSHGSMVVLGFYLRNQFVLQQHSVLTVSLLFYQQPKVAPIVLCQTEGKIQPANVLSRRKAWVLLKEY